MAPAWCFVCDKGPMICDCSTHRYCSCGPAHRYCIEDLRIGNGDEKSLIGNGSLWNCPKCKDKWVLDRTDPPVGIIPEMERRAKALRAKEEKESVRGLFIWTVLSCVGSAIGSYSKNGWEEFTPSFILLIICAPFVSAFLYICVTRYRDPLWKRVRTEVCNEYPATTRFYSDKVKDKPKQNPEATSPESKV